MSALRTALLLSLALSLVGCSKIFQYTSQVTVNRWDPLSESAILIDPSLMHCTNDVGSKGGLFGPRTDQRIVIDYDGPLKLVPATAEDVAAMQAGHQPAPGRKEP